MTIAGKNDIYNRENLVRPFLVHQVLGPKPPPPLPPPLLKRSPATGGVAELMRPRAFCPKACPFKVSAPSLRGPAMEGPRSEFPSSLGQGSRVVADVDLCAPLCPSNAYRIPCLTPRHGRIADLVRRSSAGVAFASCTQIAVFVVPFTVFVGMPLRCQGAALWRLRRPFHGRCLSVLVMPCQEEGGLQCGASAGPGGAFGTNDTACAAIWPPKLLDASDPVKGPAYTVSHRVAKLRNPRGGGGGGGEGPKKSFPQNSASNFGPLY